MLACTIAYVHHDFHTPGFLYIMSVTHHYVHESWLLFITTYVYYGFCASYFLCTMSSIYHEFYMWLFSWLVTWVTGDILTTLCDDIMISVQCAMTSEHHDFCASWLVNIMSSMGHYFHSLWLCHSNSGHHHSYSFRPRCAMHTMHQDFCDSCLLPLSHTFLPHLKLVVLVAYENKLGEKILSKITDTHSVPHLFLIPFLSLSDSREKLAFWLLTNT